jgi:hypothetical protein
MNSEPEDGLTDLVRADGEHMRARFRGGAARHPDVAAGLVRLLLEPLDGDVYQAISSYASGLGLGATYYLGTERVIIEIYEPPTLVPLVNASGGSPRSRDKARDPSRGARLRPDDGPLRLRRTRSA